MADYAPTVTGMDAQYPRFSWSSIFAGTFVFLAIEVTLLVLGFAIFASAASPGGNAGWAPGTGFTIYATIISIIALYFGGRAAGRLCGATNRNVGTYHGLVTFGMSVFTTILIAGIALGSTVAGTSQVANAGPQRVADLLVTGGWGLFVALVSGMAAAAMGAAGEVSAHLRAPVSTTERQTLRPAA